MYDKKGDFMRRFTNCVIVTVCYWLLLLIGPALVRLWNDIGYSFAGAGYGSESFMYKVLIFFSQPISCFIAAAAAGNLFSGKHRLCTFVNCIVSACLCAAMSLNYFFFDDNLPMFGVMICSAIVCIITSVTQAKGLVYLDDKEMVARRERNRTVQRISPDYVNFAAGDAILAEPFMPLNSLHSHYRDEDGDLLLKMKNGSEYCYYDFPESLYSEMMHSGDPTAFIQNNIIGKYVCEKIE